jgi:pimeloyl-ACP methyl ester carboxylesterase
MATVLMVAAGVVAVVGGAIAALSRLKDSVVYAPQPLAHSDSRLDKLPTESVSTFLQVTDTESSSMIGDRVWVVTRRTNPALPMVVFSHGNGSTITDHVALLCSFPNVALYDYRGYGLSRGECNEQTNLQDLVAVVQFVCDRYALRTPSRDIVLMGRSLGTNVTLAYLEYCSRRGLPAPARTILVHPFLSLSSASGAPDLLCQLVGNMDRTSALRDYVSSPHHRLLTVVSATDNVTPPQPLYALRDSLDSDSQARFEVYEIGGDHQHINAKLLWDRVRAFIFNLSLGANFTAFDQDPEE